MLAGELSFDMKKISHPLPEDKKANKFHMGIAIMEDGQVFFSIAMTDIHEEIIAHGTWSREDWERMKKDMDDTWANVDIGGRMIDQ